MEKELMRGLKILNIEDRDFKSLLVWVNPNHINWSDLEAGVMLRKEINNLIKDNIIKNSISPKGRKIYSLIPL